MHGHEKTFSVDSPVQRTIVLGIWNTVVETEHAYSKLQYIVRARMFASDPQSKRSDSKEDPLQESQNLAVVAPRAHVISLKHPT